MMRKGIFLLVTRMERNYVGYMWDICSKLILGWMVVGCEIEVI